MAIIVLTHDEDTLKQLSRTQDFAFHVNRSRFNLVTRKRHVFCLVWGAVCKKKVDAAGCTKDDETKQNSVCASERERQTETDRERERERETATEGNNWVSLFYHNHFMLIGVRA